MRRIDLTGQKFHRWTVIERVDFKSGQTLWLCECECGKRSNVGAGNLKRGISKSCGCLKREVTVKRNYKHGHSVRGNISSEYGSWYAMIQRCTNPNHQKYKDYGGRGITVCDRWRESFEEFLKDIGLKPSPDHTIDRKDNDGNYEPGNCRWATPEEQSRNKRIQSSNKSGVSGVFFDKRSGRWVATINFNKKQIYLGSFNKLRTAGAARKRVEEALWIR